MHTGKHRNGVDVKAGFKQTTKSYMCQARPGHREPESVSAEEKEDLIETELVAE